MLIAALIRKTKNEELGSDFYMWEKDENLNNCRECQGAFTVMKRRHHCRNCGGLFCEACTLTNVLVDGETCDRCCHGCIKGETPGENVRNLVERKFANVSTADPRVSIYPLAVNYGSQFDIDAKSPAKAAPTAGYFELINKTNSFCAVKIIYNTTGNEFETLREIPRPSYTAVPPNGIVNCNFPTDISFFELFILMSNPNQVPPSVGNEVSSSLVYNTKASSASAPLKVSPAASIRLFRHFQAYRIRCDGKNVMLKYKADGSLEPRAGNSIARVGVFGKLLGSGKSSSTPAEEGNSTLDFSTNVSVAQIEKLIDPVLRLGAMSSFSSMLAPGFNVRNESNIPILVVLSQISPLHWCKVEPGESKHMDCGRVFFTVSVEPWMDGKEPTRAEVAARLALVIGTTVLGGGFLGFTVSGLISGLTSVKGLRMSGVYANGRTMVIRGQVNSVDFAHVNLESETLESRTVPTGVYQLYIYGLEWADKNNTSTAAATQPPLESPLLQSDSVESRSFQSQSTIHFDRSDENSPSPQSPLKIASMETQVLITHPFYSEESVAKEVGTDGNEENEVVFSILGEEDDENFEHTADYIQQS